jgi:exodeoxyribonuclease VII large subunit
VPDVAEELAGVTQARRRAAAALRARLDREAQGLAGMRARPVLADPHRMLQSHAEQVTQLRDRARGSLRAALDRAGDGVGHLRERVAALSPAATLARGYAIVQTAEGDVVRDPAEVPAGDLLRLRLAGGDLAAWAEGPWAEGPWAENAEDHDEDLEEEFQEEDA